MSLELNDEGLDFAIAVGIVNYAFTTDPTLHPGILQCLVCEEVSPASQMSEFWKSGVSCPNGHPQEIEVDAASQSRVKPGVCSSCEMQFVLEVLDGDMQCRAAGCRKYLKIDSEAITERVHHIEVVRCVLLVQPRRSIGIVVSDRAFLLVDSSPRPSKRELRRSTARCAMRRCHSISETKHLIWIRRRKLATMTETSATAVSKHHMRAL